MDERRRHKHLLLYLRQDAGSTGGGQVDGGQAGPRWAEPTIEMRQAYQVPPGKDY